MKTQNFFKVTLFAAALLGSSAFASTGTGADGSPVKEARDARQVTVTSQTKYFNVHHGDVLSFTLADGAQFGWKFDGRTNYVNLADIAPKGSISQDVRVYVEHHDTHGGR